MLILIGVAGGEEGDPGRFDDPVDDPVRVQPAERGEGRQGVEDVSHGAETDDKEAVAGLGLQDFILAEVAELAALCAG